MTEQSTLLVPLGEILDRLVERATEQELVSFRTLVEVANLDPAHDFVGAFLQNIDFRGEDLRGFDFSEADLTGADFRGANVAGVRFDGAILTGAIGLFTRHKSKILYVEPNILVARNIMNDLNLYGKYEVLHAKNVKEALTLANQHKTIRVVVTEISIANYAPFKAAEVERGVTAGLHLVRRLEELLPNAKMIAMSISLDPRVIDVFENLESVVYAGKYLTWKELQRKLDSVLEHERELIGL